MRQTLSLALLGATALAAASLAVMPLAQAQTSTQQQSQQYKAPAQTPNDGPNKQRTTNTTKAEKSETMRPITAGNYVLYAQTADLFESEAAKIAVQRAQNKDVREYAKRVVTDNATTSSKVSAAAQQAGVAPATVTLTAKQVTKLNDLRNASDAAFDRMYITAQLESQERELRLHNSYAQNGEQPALRTTSTELVPVARKHIADAKVISGQLGNES